MAVSLTIFSTSWDLFTTTSRVNGCFNEESEPTNAGSSSTDFEAEQGELVSAGVKIVVAQRFSTLTDRRLRAGKNSLGLPSGPLWDKESGAPESRNARQGNV
jgi:hypothetical protein